MTCSLFLYLLLFTYDDEDEDDDDDDDNGDSNMPEYGHFVSYYLCKKIERI